MECKEACRCINPFLDGTYPVNKEAPLLIHYKNCESCRKELAVSLSLKKAMDALDNEEDSLDFINEEPEEAVDSLLYEASQHYHAKRKARAYRLGLYTITGWALIVGFILQVLYWKSTGFLF